MGSVYCNWQVISVWLQQLGNREQGQAAAARENDIDYEIGAELQQKV